jgi:hypothetical protein
MARLKTEPTVDEIIATLNHSNLPTLVIEGNDDVIIFRRLEEQAPNLTLSVLPVGGRASVLALYDRKGEIRSGQSLAFVADLDLWVFSGKPKEYHSTDLIFTEGYSIENDAFRDVDCEKLLVHSEKHAFREEVKIFAEWYALAVSRCSNESTVLDIHEPHLELSKGARTPYSTATSGTVSERPLRQDRIRLRKANQRKITIRAVPETNARNESGPSQ